MSSSVELSSSSKLTSLVQLGDGPVARDSVPAPRHRSEGIGVLRRIGMNKLLTWIHVPSSTSCGDWINHLPRRFVIWRGQKVQFRFFAGGSSIRRGRQD